MTDKNYHPDGFVPMNPPEQKWSDEVRALERGIAFFEELRSNGHTGVVTTGASVKPNSPVGGVSLMNISHPFNPDSLEQIEIEIPDDCIIRSNAPLNVKQIEDLWTKSGTVLIPEKFEKIVRMIEAAHGIV